MATDHPIAPFPAHLDRDAFGHWLSGFTDGEGHFGLRWHKASSTKGRSVFEALFTISLRADDVDVLHLIRSFWQCGSVKAWERPRGARMNQHACATLRVYGPEAAETVIVPHFDRYPLRAKKARDYLLWREAVIFYAPIRCRASTSGGKSEDGRPGGGRAKYSPDERAHLEALTAALKAGRKLQALA